LYRESASPEKLILYFGSIEKIGCGKICLTDEGWMKAWQRTKRKLVVPDKPNASATIKN
jgi:hypothetical protein